MFLGLGVASLAAGAVRGLTQLVANKPANGATNPFQIDSSATKAKGQPINPANTTALSSGTISPATMMSLFEAQSGQPSRNELINGLYSKLDSNANGSISESEFVSSLGAGGANAANAKAVFSAIDKNSDGIIRVEELSAGISKPDGELSLASSRAIASYLKMENVMLAARNAGKLDISTGEAL